MSEIDEKCIQKRISENRIKLFVQLIALTYNSFSMSRLISQWVLQYSRNVFIKYKTE